MKQNTVHHGKALNSEWVIMHLLFYFWSRRQTTISAKKIHNNHTHIHLRYRTAAHSPSRLLLRFRFVCIVTVYFCLTANAVWANQLEVSACFFFVWGKFRLATAKLNSTFLKVELNQVLPLMDLCTSIRKFKKNVLKFQLFWILRKKS